MKVTVLGCGRWGTFLAWYAASLGNEVYLWGRPESNSLQQLVTTRANQYLQLPDQIRLGSSLTEALAFSNYILISISAQNLRSLAQQINELNLTGKIYILCMKGLESATGKRLSQVFSEEVRSHVDLAIWVGPGHVQDFVNGIPNCMVIGSAHIETTKRIVQKFGSDLIRFYYGQDLIGNEIGAASKNVMGIAAGMLDGLHYTSLKGALMARGTREISRLVRGMGGNELTPYGLSHLGDYEATLFSPHSHNRKFGEAFVQGNPFDKLAEGAATVKALKLLSGRYDIELPICNAIHNILYENADPKDVLLNLFLRPVKSEF